MKEMFDGLPKWERRFWGIAFGAIMAGGLLAIAAIIAIVLGDGCK